MALITTRIVGAATALWCAAFAADAQPFAGARLSAEDSIGGTRFTATWRDSRNPSVRLLFDAETAVSDSGLMSVAARLTGCVPDAITAIERTGAVAAVTLRARCPAQRAATVSEAASAATRVVQVATFRSRANAVRTVERLSAAGIHAKGYVLYDGGVRYFEIAVRTDAAGDRLAQLLRDMRRMGFHDAFVDPDPRNGS